MGNSTDPQEYGASAVVDTIRTLRYLLDPMPRRKTPGGLPQEGSRPGEEGQNPGRRTKTVP